jgi:hypothetical protein
MYASLSCLNALLSDNNFRTLMDGLKNASEKTFIPKNQLREKIVEERNELTLDEASLIAINNFTVDKLRKIILGIAKEFICSKGNGLHINDGMTIIWKEYILNNGEDLFCCALSADQMKADLEDEPKLDWPFCLSLDNPRLNQILAKGYSENHLHFNGSAPIFYLNWASMNQAQGISKIKTKARINNANECLEDQADNFFLWCQRGYLLRRYLVYFLHKCKSGCFENNSELTHASLDLIDCLKHLETPGEMFSASIGNRHFLQVNFLAAKYDYAESLFYRKADSIECGERRLLYLCFLHFDEYPTFFKTAFYLYLIAKKKVASFFFQCNGRYGFANFSLYQKFCEIFTDGTKFEADVSFFLARYLTENQGLRSAEIRLSPSSTYQNCKKKTQSIYLNFEKGLVGTSNEKLQYGLVFHFIKKKDIHLADPLLRQCRHYAFRKDIYQQGLAIKKLLIDAPTKTLWAKQMSEDLPFYSYLHHPNMVKGIDAANSEIFTRPEVFAPVYRMLREYVFFDPYQQEKRHLGLSFTYHVGEDFIGAVDGLRAIWEAINYLDFTSGDRLGHCTVLGIDISSYYHLKSCEITKKKQGLLDDYVFLLTSLQQGGYSDGQLFCKLESKINELIQYIYKADNATIRQYRNSMLLRGMTLSTTLMLINIRPGMN